MERLLEQGALDVFFTPIYMKKNRPAYCLTILCLEKDLDIIKGVLFQETTTIGIRYRQEQRLTLKREVIKKKTVFGFIQMKEVVYNGRTYFYPEYEDMKRIAREKNIAIREVYKKVMKGH